jgi:hypothetical protein
MSADNRNTDGTEADEYGGFVFEDDGASGGNEADAPLEERLAPVVALLVVASLVLTGGYIAVTALSGSNGDVLGSSAGSGGENGPVTANGPAERSPTAAGATTTAATTAATATSAAGATTSAADGGTTAGATPGTETPRAAGTDAPTTDPSKPSSGGPTVIVRTIAPGGDVETPRSIETGTPSEPTAIEAAAGPTGEPSEDASTAAPESRSPSIEGFTVAPDGSGGESMSVAWAVADPDGDLETVRLEIVAGPGGSAEVVSSRVIEVDGSGTEGETELATDGIEPDEAYEVQFRVEDEAGNAALAVTRGTASG